MAALKIGSKGGPVKKLQGQLNKAGAKPKLNADGMFGKLTAEAVKALQKKNSLKADGIVGGKTEAVLGGGKGGGAGGGKSGGAGDGKKGYGGGLSKETRQKLDKVSVFLFDHLDDCMAIEDGIEKAHKAFKGKSDLPETEKAKQLKPLTALFSKTENSQKKLVTSVITAQGLMGQIDQKSADRSIKKLVKLGLTVNATAKNYVGYSKSSKQKSAAFLKNFANDDLKPFKNLKRSFSEIYVESKPGTKFTNAWFDFVEQINKAG